MELIARRYNIEEGSADPFSIPPRPTPVSTSSEEIRYVKLLDAAYTYAVYRGDPPSTTLLGYVRWTTEDVWVARTLGCPHGTAPASIARRSSCDRAVAWLSSAVNGVVHRRHRARGGGGGQ